MISAVALPFGRNPVQDIFMLKIHFLRTFLTFKQKIKRKDVSLEIVNPHTAGIDVGSRSHYAAVGQRDKDIKEFGVYAEDLDSITRHFTENNVSAVVMESSLKISKARKVTFRFLQPDLFQERTS